MSHHLVAAEHLRYRYPDGTLALDDVSFTIRHGEAVGIIGENGAGKSTLINHLNGYFLPETGRILIGHQAVDKRSRPEIRRRVGVVFQNPDDQIFLSKVYDDVAFGPRNLGLAEDKVAALVQSALELLSAWELRDRPSHNLSDGQKRAVAIAGVLAMEPDVLVMDEPTSNLDPRNRRYLIGFLNGFLHSKIIVSHDLDFIWETCARTLVLREGKLVADGRTKEILVEKALLESCGLELPLRLQGGT
ncbi:MAG: ABC transporter ATP-binding protein [Fibrobacteria bacterium]